MRGVFCARQLLAATAATPLLAVAKGEMLFDGDDEVVMVLHQRRTRVGSASASPERGSGAAHMSCSSAACTNVELAELWGEGLQGNSRREMVGEQLESRRADNPVCGIPVLVCAHVEVAVSGCAAGETVLVSGT